MSLPVPANSLKGPKKHSGMVDRHHGQVLARHGGDHAAPQAGADHHVVGHDRAALGDDARDAPALQHERGRGRVGEAPQLAGALGPSTSRPATVCERGTTRPASGSHSPPWTMLSSTRGNLALISAALHQPGPRAEGLAGRHLAADLRHALVVADPGHLDAADAGVVAHPVEEIDGIERRPARQEVVAGRVAEVRGVGGRADVGRDAGLVDADDVVPAPLDEVVHHRGADDAAEADDDHPRVFGESCHGTNLARRTDPVASLDTRRRGVCRPPDGGCRGSGEAGSTLSHPSPSVTRRAMVTMERGPP